MNLGWAAKDSVIGSHYPRKKSDIGQLHLKEPGVALLCCYKTEFKGCDPWTDMKLQGKIQEELQGLRIEV